MDIESIFMLFMFSPVIIIAYAIKQNVGEKSIMISFLHFLGNMFIIMLNQSNKINDILSQILLILLLFLCWYKIFRYKKELLKVKQQILNSESINISKFMEFSGSDIIPGTYVLHNLNNDKFYVGLSKDVIYRVKSHLNGRGNFDLFYDLKRGDDFNIYIMKFD